MSYVVCFHGIDHKCGTSMLAQCTAERLAADFHDKKVILVHAEQGPGNTYAPMVNESLEHIRPYLAEKLIDTEELLTKCRYRDNLFILGGVSRPGSNYLYHPDMAEYLIEKISEIFDYVICDTGSEIEHGMCIGALFKADAVYQVITQSETAVRRYEALCTLFEKLNLKAVKLVINKYENDRLNSVKLLKDRLVIKEEDIICIRNSSFGSKAEEDGKSLLCYRDKNFAKGIREICDDIIQRSKQDNV